MVFCYFHFVFLIFGDICHLVKYVPAVYISAVDCFFRTLCSFCPSRLLNFLYWFFRNCFLNPVLPVACVVYIVVELVVHLLDLWFLSLCRSKYSAPQISHSFPLWLCIVLLRKTFFTVIFWKYYFKMVFYIKFFCLNITSTHGKNLTLFFLNM